jgi:lipopolysaccharide/colanic/teichoic acid biosynthesis glycosyltransferase
VGRVLRRLSLDELPQLFNVFGGDMSLVGPRPHVMAMKAGERLYHEAVGDYFHRHRVRPGMTGWAQVHGLRGEIDTPEKAQARVAYDLWYIDHWSIWLDQDIFYDRASDPLRTERLLRRLAAWSTQVPQEPPHASSHSRAQFCAGAHGHREIYG